MRSLDSGVSSISAPDITDINPSTTPSLVGYWKCSDYSNGVIPDHSGNGYDLKMTCAKYQNNIGDNACGLLPSGVHLVNGYLGMEEGWTGLINATGTLLDTGSNFVIWGAELYSEETQSDSDFGTAWQGTPYVTDDADPFNGFQLQTVGLARAARVNFADGASALNAANAGLTDVGDRTILVAGFRPSTSLVGAYQVIGSDGSIKSSGTDSDTVPAPPASLTAQNGKFGLRATHLQSVPIKNYYVWSFSSEPVYMTETVEWLSKNPGKIPPWWIGR